MSSAPFTNGPVRILEPWVRAEVHGSCHGASRQLGAMNSLVAGERFCYFGSDLDESTFEIQSRMAAWPRESGGSNEGPHFAARRRHEPRQLLRRHTASSYSSRNWLRLRQFNLIAHILWAT